ncbi:MAG: hypothetical protein ACMG6S_15820, partial [Byssovorax sp.]
ASLHSMPAAPAPLAGRTHEGVATSRAGTLAPAPASSGGRFAALGVVAGIIAVGAAFGVYRVMEADTSAPVVASAPSAPPPPVVAPAVDPTAEVAKVAAPGAKTVRVGILPLDATVEVDGEKATVSDGGVEIAGGLGTVHRVHITRGDDQVTEDVAVTQQGAVPAKLELKTSAPKGLKGPR